MMTHYLSLRRALLWILLSTLGISGSTALGVLYFQHVRELQARDPKFTIIAIMQTGPEKEALKSVYLAELLNLSIDNPTNLYGLNSRDAERNLLASPLIKRAEVKKIIPGSLYIDYTARKPVAFLADYSNTAVDAEGYLFPFKPFFTPKKLPEIVLGLSAYEIAPNGVLWGSQIKGARAELALELLSLSLAQCCAETSYLRKVDVSQAYAPSYGQRQIVVTFEDQAEIEKEGRSVLIIHPRILRLNTENYSKALADYSVLRKYLHEKETEQQVVPDNENVIRAPAKIIDLRIPDLAFLSEGKMPSKP